VRDKLSVNGIAILNEGNKAYRVRLGIITFSVVEQGASAQMRTILWTVELGKIDVDGDVEGRTVKLDTPDKDLLWNTTIQDGPGYRWNNPVTKYSFRQRKSGMKRTGYEEI
jgi:hypothetical protein